MYKETDYLQTLTINKYRHGTACLIRMLVPFTKAGFTLILSPSGWCKCLAEYTKTKTDAQSALNLDFVLGIASRFMKTKKKSVFQIFGCQNERCVSDGTVM